MSVSLLNNVDGDVDEGEVPFFIFDEKTVDLDTDELENLDSIFRGHILERVSIFLRRMNKVIPKKH